MHNLGKIIVVIVVLVIILFVVGLYLYVNRKIFPRKRRLYKNRNHKYREHDVRGVNVRVYNCSGDKCPMVLYCHGNTGNVSQRSYVVEICKIFGWNVTIFDYRGYGKSKGSPTTRNILEDGLDVYDYISQKHGNVMVWGESLGGGVAAYICSQRRSKALILFSTYASLYDVAKYNPEYGDMMGMLLVTMAGDVKTCEYLRLVKCPVVIVHSVDDTYINIKNAEINLGNCPDRNAKLIRIHGDHAEPQIKKDDIVVIMQSLPKDCRRELADDDYEKISQILLTAAKCNKLNLGTKSTNRTLPIL